MFISHLLPFLFEDNIKLINKKKVKLTFNDDIIDSDLIIKEEVRRRNKIPKKVRQDVFEKRNGKNYNGKCYVCDKDIDIFNFHVGHVQSIFNGGSDNLDNLEPICPGCNYSMGKENLEFYKNKYYNN